MYKAKKFISYMALCVLIFSLCACGEKGSENAAIYGETVGELEDNELFAIIDTNASLPVLLVTSQVYNDGLGNQAALNCDVYYLIDKEVKNIGTIESMGTAYPIAYDETGIYAASGHDMQRFEIEKSGSLRLAEGIYEQFDESGNAAYTMKKGEETDVITEEEYYALAKEIAETYTYYPHPMYDLLNLIKSHLTSTTYSTSFTLLQQRQQTKNLFRQVQSVKWQTSFLEMLM